MYTKIRMSFTDMIKIANMIPMIRILCFSYCNLLPLQTRIPVEGNLLFVLSFH